MTVAIPRNGPGNSFKLDAGGEGIKLLTGGAFPPQLQFVWLGSAHVSLEEFCNHFQAALPPCDFKRFRNFLSSVPGFPENVSQSDSHFSILDAEEIMHGLQTLSGLADSGTPAISSYVCDTPKAANQEEVVETHEQKEATNELLKLGVDALLRPMSLGIAEMVDFFMLAQGTSTVPRRLDAIMKGLSLHWKLILKDAARCAKNGQDFEQKAKENAELRGVVLRYRQWVPS